MTVNEIPLKFNRLCFFQHVSKSLELRWKLSNNYFLFQGRSLEFFSFQGGRAQQPLGPKNPLKYEDITGSGVRTESTPPLTLVLFVLSNVSMCNKIK